MSRTQLSTYLLDARKTRHLTLKRVADDAALSVPFVNEAERGLRRPAPSSLRRLCTALGADYLTAVSMLANDVRDTYLERYVAEYRANGAASE